MTYRDKRGGRRGGMGARLAVAAAVLVGGGAAAALAISAGHGSATTAQSAGYTLHFRHRISEPAALTAAMDGWRRSPARSMTTLAKMRPMRTFSQHRRHGTMLAAQRGIVLLATRRFLVVRSANGSLHLWWLNRGTRFVNVSSSAAGMTAMTGNNRAAMTAMATGDMTRATTVMAGSTGMMSKVMTPTATMTTMRIGAGGKMIRIAVTGTTATVRQTVTRRHHRLYHRTTWATQSAFMARSGVTRGDLALVIGVRRHGSLFARIVLFAPPTTVTPTPSATTSMTATPTMSATPTVIPSMTVTPAMPSGTGAPTFTGSHS